MQHILKITSIVALVMATPAMAADPFGGDPTFDTPFSFGPAHDWSGIYVGAHSGYAWAKGTDDVGGSAEFDGFVGGLHLGYNHMIGNIMIGAEVDGSLTDAQLALGLGHIEWMASARIRAGVTHGRIMAFATGGVSAAGIEVGDAAIGPTDSNDHVGWVIGAGIEAFVTQALTARIEYQYHEFGQERYDLGGMTDDLSANVDIVRVGLSYHF